MLVGHSYGGMVISQGGTGNPNVKALVYVGAFAPDAGESAIELSGKFPGSTLGDALAPVKPAWKTIPSRFLFGSEDLNIPAAAHRFMAGRAGSRRTVELAGGSHTVAIPEAAALVELITEAAS